MAYFQQSTPPPNKILTFSLQDFTGGLNNRANILEDNQASDVVNMIFTDEQIMEKRKGTMFANDLVFTTPVTFIDEYKPYVDPNQLLYSTNTELFLNDIKLRDLSGELSGLNFDGKYFFTDSDKLYVYGKFPQVDTTYQKVLGVAVNGYVILEVVIPPTGFTPLDTTHKEGVTRFDYANEKVWYEPCKLEIDDTYSGANVPPEKVKYLASHNGRIYASGNNKDNDNVFITDVRKPYYFPVANPLQLPPNSDVVVGLVVYDDSVLVSRKEDIYMIQGKTANPELGFEVFTLRRLNVHAGFANHKTVNIAHNFLFYFGSDGNAYAMSNLHQEQRLVITTIISQQIDLFKAPISVTKVDLAKASSYFFMDMWYVSIGDKTLVYSYRHRAWTMFTKLNIQTIREYNDELIFSNSAGRILKFSDDYMDNGEPYLAFWQSRYFDMDDANSQKQFREFFIVAHTFDDRNSDIRMKFEIDYVDVKNQVLIENQVSRWGNAVFGDRFITRNIVASLPFVIGRRGRSIRFKHSSSYDRHGTVATYDDLRTYVGRQDNVMVYVTDESKFYLYFEREWSALEDKDLNQPMRLYQINGDYEFRGKR